MLFKNGSHHFNLLFFQALVYFFYKFSIVSFVKALSFSLQVHKKGFFHSDVSIQRRRIIQLENYRRDLSPRKPLNF